MDPRPRSDASLTGSTPTSETGTDSGLAEVVWVESRTSEADRGAAPHGSGEAEPETPPESPDVGPGSSVIRRRRKGVVTAVTVATLLIVLAAVAAVFSWWRGTPAPPEELLPRAAESVSEAAADLEQAAFLERRRRDRGLDRLPGSGEPGASLTDRD
ncbi:MAG: hypothetical protein MI919_35865, partial [Holophagales bacterium]|nr:hypothetical protein [Holophagales bacterium]